MVIPKYVASYFLYFQAQKLAFTYKFLFFHTQIECVAPVLPEEIREVVRRYWSNQLCPFGLFSRTFSRNLQGRIMACS